MVAELNHASLAQALRDSVRAVDLAHIPDSLCGGQPTRQHPSLDLAVVAFPREGAPVWANVLFSRDFPEGRIAAIPADAGPVGNIRYLADQLDSALECTAWLPGSNWDALQWQTLAGDGPDRFVAPYPASLIKFMVAVGVAQLVDAGLADWDEAWAYQGHAKPVHAWCDAMIVVSCNDATSAMVALLHARGLIRHEQGRETANGLHALFQRAGLGSLRLADTKPDGGWRNADGAGVGHLQMTAWDTVRLMWLLLPEAPTVPWLGADQTAPLSAASRQRLWGWMADQGLHEILSSTVLAGVPGWQPGIPARLPARWLRPDGGAVVDDHVYPADIRPINAAATARFAHKTGTTDNYASDAGLVEGDGGRRYLIAMTTSLGRRYAASPECASDWRLPRIGRAIDDWLRLHLE